MMYSSIPTAQSVVQHCKARNISDVVISPGSRNAPLILSFTNDPFFNCYSIVDERSAAFFALGIIQQTDRPVVVVCTSGSALLNYYPAVVEAFYSDYPLVVISADRPGYKIDIGDGQTIRQDRVFDRHIGYSANLRQDVVHATEEFRKWNPALLGNEKDLELLQIEIQAYNDEELNRALEYAIRLQGPIHINVPFEEPLYNKVDELGVKPLIRDLSKQTIDEIDNLSSYAHLWNTAERKIILVGLQHPQILDPEILEAWATDPSVVVLTETTSNIHNSSFFNSIDSVIAPLEKSDHKSEYFEMMKPEIVITLGGMIVSKKIKAFLREYQPRHHWHVGEKKAYNTFRCLTEHFKISPNQFFTTFHKHAKDNQSNYRICWNELRDNYRTNRKKYLSASPFSDLTAFHPIMKSIPDGYQLQLANSSSIRYSQLFEMNPEVRVFCNRGASGIDGSTSTAVGASQYDSNPTLLISGDLSFLYDDNAFWNDYLRKDFRIIVINNGGGGIFRILPGKENSTTFERFFETTHSVNLRQLCEVYGIHHQLALDEQSLEKELGSFYSISDCPKLLEIQTPRLLNDQILLNYFDFLAAELTIPGTQKNKRDNMSKKDELLNKYAAHIKDKFGETPDMDFLNKVVVGLGPAIYNRDAATVSSSSESELETVKKNFLIKKLGLTDSPQLMEAIKDVMYTYGTSERTKYRAVVYYILARHFQKESVYNG